LVQTLQIIYGRKPGSTLRHPNTVKTIEALGWEGVVGHSAYAALLDTYIFLRALIDALRMARGNAKDLAIPEWNSKASALLARRLVYPKIEFSGDDEQVNQVIRKACEEHMKTAGEFYERIMKELAEAQRSAQSPGGPAVAAGGPSAFDISEILREIVPASALKTLETLGFVDIEEVVLRLKRFCQKKEIQEAMNESMRVASSLWSKVPEPDLALKHLERFGEAVKDPARFWNELFRSGKKFETLLVLFGSSQYLSEILIDHPEYWDWFSDDNQISCEAAQTALAAAGKGSLTIEQLRLLRQRETLRIAAAEMFQKNPLVAVYKSFSALADFVVQRAVDIVFENKQFSIIGLGKLGGRELNFSSDIDLMFVTAKDEPNADWARRFQKFAGILNKKTVDGFLYRVDLRLRPNGDSGAICLDRDDTLRYYKEKADFWEYQMLLKARPVGADKELGESLIRDLDPLYYRESWPAEALERLREVKRIYEEDTASKGETESNIKMGRGGIRDIEFSAQLLQLFHGHDIPELKTTNTLEALKAIKQHRLLPEADCDSLSSSYEFLRRIENRIHWYANQQVFNLPEDNRRLRALAKSLSFCQGPSASEERFMTELNRSRDKCRVIFERVFFGKK
jgi:glutamate-ammonia-ligase adenylyltransferase